MIRVKVPATSANIGAGFDCLGIALDLYNIIEAEEIESGLKITIPESDKGYIETDERNLVFISMKRLFDEVGYRPKGLHINLINNIPITRGLIGGMTVACIVEGEVKYVRIDLPDYIKLLVMVPDFQLPTSEARAILPQNVPMQDAVFNISRAALLTASLITGRLDNLPAAVDDRLHQPYRKGLIPHWDEIMSKMAELGTKGTFLSGAGPTLITIMDKDYDNIRAETCKFLAAFEQHWDVYIMDVCRYGAELLAQGKGEIVCR
ncbi:homoserine kinase [Mahella sp.]|uniref:homoserine kinase n=1 Tax=Mahella sp. TaxID=2798721 RepID=UPI0025BF817A|nr:homoserine kinase [Mahella sp.]MBZ4666569.1 homoserine kinase [Mahella sp.]